MLARFDFACKYRYNKANHFYVFEFKYKKKAYDAIS